MNNSIGNQTGPVAARPLRAGGPARGEGPAQLFVSAPPRLPVLLRIVHHWRWLILGALAIGVAGAIVVTLLTAPVYRASVTLEANPPTVEVTDEQSKSSGKHARGPYAFVVTQVGLLSSETVAQRTAQELNLGNNPAFVPQTGDASTRLKTAARMVRAASRSLRPKRAASSSSATIRPRRRSPLWSPTALPTASSIRRCNAGINRRPMPAISCSGRLPRPAAISKGRSERWSLMPSARGSFRRARMLTASRPAAMRAPFRESRWSLSTRRWPMRRRGELQRKVPIAARLQRGRPATSRRALRRFASSARRSARSISRSAPS